MWIAARATPSKYNASRRYTLPLGHENSELAFPKPNCAACHPLSEWDFGGDNMAGEGPTGNDPRVEENQMNNDDLLDVATELQDDIRRAYQLHEEHRPVMLFDIQEQRL